jgi:hypothetical protein
MRRRFGRSRAWTRELEGQPLGWPGGAAARGGSLPARSALSIDRGRVGVGLAVESSQRALLRTLAAEGCLDPVLAGPRRRERLPPPVHRAGPRSHRRGALFRRPPQQFVSAASVSAAGCLACSDSGQAPRELAQLPRDYLREYRPRATLSVPPARLRAQVGWSPSWVARLRGGAGWMVPSSSAPSLFPFRRVRLPEVGSPRRAGRGKKPDVNGGGRSGSPRRSRASGAGARSRRPPSASSPRRASPRWSLCHSATMRKSADWRSRSLECAAGRGLCRVGGSRPVPRGDADWFREKNEPAPAS